MSLLGLPAAMLKEILKLTKPADLAGITHSCRLLYNLLRDDLLAHMYGTVEVKGPEGIAVVNRSDGLGILSTNSPSRLLRTIKHFPHIAEFPTHVVVDWQLYCWCQESGDASHCVCPSKEKYLLEGVAFEALLTQLRKVKRITFKGMLSPMLGTIISNLARKSLQRDIPQPADITNLLQLSLFFNPEDDHGLVDLRLLMWAALISSLKTLDIYNIDTAKDWGEWPSVESLNHCGSGTLYSNVTELNIINCDLGVPHFWLFMSGFVSLHSLAIKIKGGNEVPLDQDYGFDYRFGERLPLSTRRSLRKLRLES